MSNDEEWEDVEPVSFGRALELTWDGDFWSGDLRLRSFAPLIKGRSKTCMVELPNSDGYLPKAVQRGLTWLVANQAAVAKALVHALVESCAPLVTKKTIGKNVSLTTAIAHDVVYGPKPYLGFELHADFEPEHGVGVVLHGTRVVKVGHASVAIEDHAAAADRRARQNKTTKPSARRSR